MRGAPSRRLLALPFLVVPVLLGWSASAAGQWRVVPSVAAQSTYSDNVGLRPDDVARTGWILDVTPGIRIERQSPRSTVFVDYRRHSLYYSSDTPPDDTQQFLDANAHWNVIDSFLALDARAAITQQPRSPFAGALAPDAAFPGGNRGEARVYEVSPSVKGYLGGLALYRLRFTETEADASDLGLPRTRSSRWSGSLRSASPSTFLGWWMDADHLRVRNRDIGELEDARIRGALVVAVLPTVRLTLSEGYEETDFVGAGRKGHDTPGVGVDWVPGERTQLTAAWERRFFGDGYNVFFTHRTPHTAWRLSAGRDATALPNQLAAANLRSVSSLLSDLLSSAQPDPVQRAAAVRARMEESSLPENTALGTGLLTAQPFLLKTIEGSAALIGRRNTVTLALTRREQVALEGAIPGLGATDVRRTGGSVNWAYRLTPVATLSLAGTWVRTDGISSPDLRTTDRAATVLYAVRLGPHATFSVGARRTQLHSSTALDYTENAAFFIFAARL